MKKIDDNKWIVGAPQTGLVANPFEVYRAIDAADLGLCANCNQVYGNMNFGMEHWCLGSGWKKKDEGKK